MHFETPPLPADDDRGGTDDCPWTVTVQQGQRINVSLIVLPARTSQRESASATYVFRGSLTDRAIHWTPQMLYNYTDQSKWCRHYQLRNQRGISTSV